MKNRILFFILFCLSSSCFASTTLVWNKKPLNINLPVDRQVHISFPGTVMIGLPTQLQGVVSVENANQTIYLTASGAFPITQIKLKTLKDNKIILINLSASKNASTDNINVVFPQQEKAKNHDSYNTNISMQSLMAYTIQQYYAPERLLTDNDNITKSMSYDNRAYNLFADGTVTAIPLDSYSSDTLNITAIYLKNNTDHVVNLKPQAICGSWVASSYFPQSKLLKAGNKGDSSMLFLVSTNDFVSNYKGTCGLGE
jgi:integrating conjugative element protein (TIGR03749 family)